jgi:hypothetical protein
MGGDVAEPVNIEPDDILDALRSDPELRAEALALLAAQFGGEMFGDLVPVKPDSTTARDGDWSNEACACTHVDGPELTARRRQ